MAMDWSCNNTLAVSNNDRLIVYDNDGEKVSSSVIRCKSVTYNNNQITDIKWASDGECNIKKEWEIALHVTCHLWTSMTRVAQIMIVSNNLILTNLRDNYNTLFTSYIYFLYHVLTLKKSVTAKMMLCCIIKICCQTSRK